MKELSIKEKAKRYDDALERAKGVIEQNPLMEYLKKGIEYIFPELKESEDEKIRKRIIDILENDKKHYLEEIAWLEKQGEKKPADEPKFKVGDWLIYNTPSRNPDICIVTEITDDLCKNRKIGEDRIRDNSIEFVNRNYRLWTIQDAKEGDVLVHNDCAFIFAGIKDGIVQAIEENILEPVPFGEPDKDNDYHPATKEQRDLLFAKMKEAGYMWDAEKKELKKIEQKPAWSEEDERMYRGLHNLIYSTPYCDSRKELSDWLKFLKDRVIPKSKQEWSEEDEICYISIMEHLKDSITYTSGRLTDWIDNRVKSLRPQSTWKPSEEQMQALSNAGNSFRPFEEGHKVLWSLYNDLKKLREE